MIGVLDMKEPSRCKYYPGTMCYKPTCDGCPKEYDVPAESVRMKVLVKTSSACGIYYRCPCCGFEMLKPDSAVMYKYDKCPSCSCELIYPVGKELHQILVHNANRYVP